MKLPRIADIKLPQLRFGSGQASAALVIRDREVLLLAMQGARAGAHVRVPRRGTDDGALAQALRQAIEEAGLRTKRVAVAIPAADVLIRYFTMPHIPKTEWDTAVQFEARKYIPFKTDSLYWDYHVMTPAPAREGSSREAAEPLEVIFAGIPQEAFERLQATLAQADIQPTLIEPVSLSLARITTAERSEAPHEFVCLVDFEEARVHLSIAKDGLPYLTRELSFVAEETETAVPSTEHGADARVQRMLSEVRVSMDFFVREHPQAVIREVLLFGEPAEVKCWETWLTGQLPCPLVLGETRLAARIEGGLPGVFAPAVGLLQRRARQGAVSLDFLKRGAAQLAKAQHASGSVAIANLVNSFKGPRLIAAGSLAAAGVLACWLAGAQQVSSAQRQLQQLISSGPAAGRGLDGLHQKDLIAIRDKAQQQLATLKKLMDGRVSVAARLDALARSLPDGVWFTGLLFEDRLDTSGNAQARLVVSGACFLGASGNELAAIQEFEDRIKRSPVLLGESGTSQMEQINAQTDPRKYTYRTFQWSCQAGRRL